MAFTPSSKFNLNLNERLIKVKKFLAIVTLVAASLSALAGTWVNQSMINPRLSAIIITNATGSATGITNLNWIWQNALQGTYSNAVLGGPAVIATNANQVMFTNASGQLVVLTNGALSASVNLPGAQIIYETLTTNGNYSTMNPFQDAYFNTDVNMTPQPFLVAPAAGSSNVVQNAQVLGLLSVVLLPNQFYPPSSGTGTVTNNVSMTLEGIPFGPIAPQLSSIMGNWPALGSQDFISGSTLTLTFTNIPQLGVGTAGNLNTPFVYQRPIMNTNFPGMAGFRIRTLNCLGTGVSTNQLSVVGIFFSDWKP